VAERTVCVSSNDKLDNSFTLNVTAGEASEVGLLNGASSLSYSIPPRRTGWDNDVGVLAPMYTSSQASAVRGRELQVACNYVAPEKSGIGKRRLEKTLSGLRKTA
jgi:hypothetical protein